MNAAGEGDEEPKFWAVFSHRRATRLKRLSLPNACSMRARALIEDFGKEAGLCSALIAIGNDRADAACSRAAARLALASYPLSARRARGHIGADVEQHFELRAVARPRRRSDGRREGGPEVGLEVDFRREAAARAAERLTSCPFCAGRRHMCPNHRQSNICTRWAVPLRLGERLEERLEYIGLAQPPEPLPNRVPVAELGRKARHVTLFTVK